MKLYQLTKEYKPLLDLKQTELAIKQIKEVFQLNLSSTLRLRRVTAPLFVLQGTGLNDDLNGYENAVSFPIQDMNGAVAEVVHSLAKWKRVTLAEYEIAQGYGIYTRTTSKPALNTSSATSIGIATIGVTISESIM